MSTDYKILLIEDDREISSTLSGVIKSAGYNIIVAPNGLEGQKLAQTENPDLVITDMMMPKMGGFPVLETLKSLPSPPKVIMITANEGGRHKAYAEMLGVDDYLRKPFAMDVFLDAIARVLAKDSDDGDDSKPAKGPLSRSRKKS
ncbi:response regulator transcription factor [Gimesia chilikensis]|uniref:Alkaline phosphatase synthesis transcriptional regulatory protein PhoP n=1 Tax=Gimesia chilikensis TaxID=2605989 RepID=A0A517WEU4_9PLAN|nr:response regulator [Gimesia chilikensis]QDU03774.1 Alkaline phosphatase synthesis transcriptional regulatory protein PhoP [Gimesia chilikensis]